MVAIADFSRSSETSLSTTSNPASAATWAMPLPIWPEPITPTFLIVTAILSSTGTARISRLFILVPPFGTFSSREARNHRLKTLLK